MIKFRVFDKEIGEYPNDEFLLEKNGNLYIKYWDRMFGWRLTNKLNEDTFILELCSMLPDITGNILYDGDIIYDEVNDVYGIIYFYNGGFTVDFDDMPEYLEECHYSCKLAGNINENKDVIPWI